MGRFGSRWLACATIMLSFFGLAACGGHKPAGPSPFPASITLTPAVSTSVQVGNIVSFTASAQNAAKSAITPTFTFQSSDTSVLNIAPNGIACAGKWDALFQTCTPGASGVAQVTASALGATSKATLVFVHPPIDNITVTDVPPSPPPTTIVPCISQNQTKTLQATAFSKGIDITSVVGPFNWSAVSSSVVTVTPIVSSSNNVPTNRATATAAVPGLTQIFAAAAGVSSTPFQQQLTPSSTVVWDFFETCPVQNITLQLGPPGSQSGQTTFSINKGTAEEISATVYDILGNVLTDAPLTWSSSQPASISAARCAGQSCSLATAQPGSGVVTASCTPPGCNVGFPQTPAGLAAPFQQFVPVPVYATTPVSGVVNGTPTSTAVVATSKDCSADFSCTAVLYNVSTSTNLPGNPITFTEPPNSFVFDLAGDKAYAGSAFGAMLVTTANLGSASTSAFSTFSSARGQVLAVSENGDLAILSDTQSAPNQVYVVTAASASSANVTPLSISGAIAAAFSPDGLKAFIIGCKAGAGQCPNGGDTLYIFSTLQALQTIPLSAPANAVQFSSNGAFAFVSGATAPAALTVFNTCNNQMSVDTFGNQQIIPLPAVPLALDVLPGEHLDGLDSTGNLFPDGMHVLVFDSTGADVITATITAPPVATSQNPNTTICPQFLSTNGNLNLPPAVPPRIEFGQGTLNPLNFFPSPDGTRLYIVASNRASILVYDFNTGSVSGIPLANDTTPLSADISTDGSLIYVAGSDGTLHKISTLTATDQLQISFNNPVNFVTPFCSVSPSTGPCKLDVVAVKP